jgi:hypothetical protein
VPGRIKLTGTQVQRVRVRGLHPLAREGCAGFRLLLAERQTLVILAQI